MAGNQVDMAQDNVTMTKFEGGVLLGLWLALCAVQAAILVLMVLG